MGSSGRETGLGGRRQVKGVLPKPLGKRPKLNRFKGRGSKRAGLGPSQEEPWMLYLKPGLEMRNGGTIWSVFVELKRDRKGLGFRPSKRKWKKRLATKFRDGCRWNLAVVWERSTQFQSMSDLYNWPHPTPLILPFLDLDSLQFHEHVSFIFCVFSLHFSFTLNALVPLIKLG